MYFKVQTLIFNWSFFLMELDMASHTFFEHLRIVNCIAVYKRILHSFFSFNMCFLYLLHMFVARCMWHSSGFNKVLLMTCHFIEVYFPLTSASFSSLFICLSYTPWSKSALQEIYTTKTEESKFLWFCPQQYFVVAF